MKLKEYQEKTLKALQSYVKAAKISNADLAFYQQTNQPYINKEFNSIPNICIKLPTGGGKTLIAAHAVSLLQQQFKNKDAGIVVWFTPSDAIKTQTLDALRNRNDYYRQVIDDEFDKKVVVLSNEEALSIKKSDVKNNICIIVTTLQAFRMDEEKRDKYKVYSQNGALLDFFTDSNQVSSLANVIANNNPVIIIDEGHRAKTTLSFDFIKNLNPAFILEMTATPRPNSNVLISIPSIDLKNEQMVKIPIYLDNYSHWPEAIAAGVKKRTELETISKKEKDYIRPIALIQAQQDKPDENKIHIEQLKSYLINELKIPEDQIATRTAKKNDLENVNLFSSDCNIRYILTVNALAEGWDCSFAYVLISVANLGAKVAVEQTIGRIVRMPYAKRRKQENLNYSYIFASAKNFQEAAAQIVSGLEDNGFSKEDILPITKEQEPIQAKKQFKDDLVIPQFTFDDDFLQFDDLVEDFQLSKALADVKFDPYADLDAQVKYDINENEKWVKTEQRKLHVQYTNEEFSKPELINWIDTKLRLPFADKKTKLSYFERVYTTLEKREKELKDMAPFRYGLKDAIETYIDDQIEVHAKNNFDLMIKSNKINLNKSYDFSPTITLAQEMHDKLSKNYYSALDKLNKEELTFITRLDQLENIKFWARNREKQDFFLQGWKKGKYYPDFIAITKSGMTLAIEWKGGDRVSNEDTKHKEEVAKVWESLGKGKLRYFLITTQNVDAKLKEIERL